MESYHVDELLVGPGEEEEDNDERDQQAEDQKEDEVALAHRLQPDDADEQQTAVFLDDGEDVHHRRIGDKLKIRVDDEHRPDHDKQDREDLADDIEHRRKFLFPRFVSHILPPFFAS